MRRESYLLTILICLLMAVTPSLLFGQEPSQSTTNIDYNNIKMPEAPNSSGFSTYGNTPVNSATGIPNISIPLYTLEIDGVSVPISLNYDASGVKVSELASSVGLNWTLSAGGGIYRSVSNRADEEDGAWFDDGFLTDAWYDLYDLNTDTPSYWQPDMRGSAPNYTNGLARLTDHNPDQFSYSFLGFSGGFIFDTNENVMKDNLDNIELDFDGFAIGTARDQNGNQYLFGPTEVSDNENAYGSYNQDGMGTYDQDDFDWPEVITGWKLSKIITKNNMEVNFLYDNVDINYVLNPSEEHISLTRPCKPNPQPSDIWPKYSKTITTYDYSNKLISEINSKKGGVTIVKITFEYETDNTLSHWKTKLKKITIFDMLSGRKKGYRFVYEKFSGDPRLKLKEIYEFGNDGTTEKPPYIFDYNTSYNLPAKNSFAQDFFGYYNNKTSNNGLVHKSPSVEGVFGQEVTFMNNNTGNRSLDANAVKMGILEKVTYPTGGRTEFTFEANSANGKYLGGLRIKEVKEIDETGTYNKKTYQYEGLNGFDMESYVYLTKKMEGPSESFYSSFVEPAGGGYMTGYYYDKVTITSIDTENSESYKEEHIYETDPYPSISFKYALKEKKYFRGSTLVKIEEYINSVIGTQRTIEWNVLGDMVCYGNVNSRRLGYGSSKSLTRTGNYSYLPTRIATTDFLQGTGLKPVTVLKDITYDAETLLKEREIVNYQTTRTVSGTTVTYPVTDNKAEILTTEYEYPWSDGIGISGLPVALPISQITHSNRHPGSDPISGQYFEYDTDGNIKRTFEYNKGAIGNTSSPVYVPNDYEFMSSFLFASGKPVQVIPKSGVATTYIWGLNGQYPVAKIEGKSRASISSSRITAVEGASYSTLPTKLTELRADASVEGALLTTYTHKPLGGVETITDPKGDKITYHYDVFGRLEYITDKEGNRLSEKKYIYGN